VIVNEEDSSDEGESDSIGWIEEGEWSSCVDFTKFR
jgi:hypothetical protein